MNTFIRPVATAIALVATASSAMPQSDLDVNSAMLSGKESAAAKEQQRIRQSKIKSVSVWQFAGRPEGAEPKGVQIAATSYDLMGNPVRQSSGGPRGNASVVERRFDALGRITEVLSGRPGALSKSLYQYDSSGNVSGVVGFAPDGSEKMTMKYEYVGQGLVGRVTVSDRSMGTSEIVRQYDGGIPKSMRMTNRQLDGSRSETLIQLGGPDAKLRKVVTDRNGNVQFRIESTLDQKGNALDLVLTDAKGKILSRTRSSYDGNGNLSQRATYDSEGKTSEQTTYAYDTRDNMTEMAIQTPSGRVRTVRHYDDQGNMLEEIRYDKQDRPVLVLKYIYEYYK